MVFVTPVPGHPNLQSCCGFFSLRAEGTRPHPGILGVWVPLIEFFLKKVAQICKGTSQLRVKREIRRLSSTREPFVSVSHPNEGASCASPPLCATINVFCIGATLRCTPPMGASNPAPHLAASHLVLAVVQVPSPAGARSVWCGPGCGRLPQHGGRPAEVLRRAERAGAGSSSSSSKKGIPNPPPRRGEGCALG